MNVKIGGFGNDNYFSSTEGWLQNFYDGSRPNYGTLPPLGNVRAVRYSYEAWDDDVSTKPVKIGNLEVMTEDLGEFVWEDAMKACADLGDGWRLPTKDELNMMYENKDKIGGFDSDSVYLSSTEVDNGDAWIQFFGTGFQASALGLPHYVRAVRAF